MQLLIIIREVYLTVHIYAQKNLTLEDRILPHVELLFPSV